MHCLVGERKKGKGEVERERRREKEGGREERENIKCTKTGSKAKGRHRRHVYHFAITSKKGHSTTVNNCWPRQAFNQHFSTRRLCCTWIPQRPEQRHCLQHTNRQRDTHGSQDRGQRTLMSNPKNTLVPGAQELKKQCHTDQLLFNTTILGKCHCHELNHSAG